jgi:hypothetical protein
LAPHSQDFVENFDFLRMRFGLPISCNILGRPIEALYLAPAARRRNSRIGAHCWEAMQHLAGKRPGEGNKGSSATMTASRSEAAERYAQIQKRERSRKQELDDATRLRLEKTARLRQLRLAREAEDAAAKQAAHDIEAAGKGAFKKAPRSAL